MKTCVKTGALVFFLMILSMAGINPTKAKADMIDITQDGVYEYNDVQLQGRSYTAVYFEVKNYGTEQAGITLMGLRSKENILYIPSSIGNIPVTTVGGGYDAKKTKNFTQASTNEAYFWGEEARKTYKEMKIPSTVKCIESYGLDCARINKMVVPKSVEFMGGGTGIREVVIKGENTTIDEGAFACGRLKKISFPKDYQGSIGMQAFERTHLQTFVWPKYSKKDMKKKMGWAVFQGCKELEEIIFPKNVKYVYIPWNCFSDTSMLDSITFPKGVKEVVYDFQEAVAKGYATAPSRLIFKGKNTKLKGIKATKHLSNYLVTNKEYYGVKLKNREFLATGKVIAPKKSKAIRYAKKAYRFKDIKFIRNWTSRGGEAFHLMKMKWAYLK